MPTVKKTSLVVHSFGTIEFYDGHLRDGQVLIIYLDPLCISVNNTKLSVILNVKYSSIYIISLIN